MSIFYRIIIILLLIAAGYSLFGIGHFHWLYYKIHNPKAEFTVRAPITAQSQGIEKPNASLPTVKFTEFLGYKCGYCRAFHPTITEFLEVRKDIQYVVRPIEFEDEQKPSVARLALAAGLQGKFWEFHEAFLEKPDASVSEDFVKELSMLYGIDHDQLIKNANGKKVEKMIEDNMKALDYALLNSVPSFVINRHIYAINQAQPNLKKMLELISQSK